MCNWRVNCLASVSQCSTMESLPPIVNVKAKGEKDDGMKTFSLFPLIKSF
jgi:hypothetical protein